MQERYEAFTLLIAKLYRNIHRIKTEEMAEFDLKSSHVSCLYYLYKESCLTAKGLCDVCGEDKANVSRTVRYLETNGYLTCGDEHGKRYQGILRLTEKGEKLGRYIAEKIDGILGAASAGLSEEDRCVMYRSLRLIDENLEKIYQRYGE